MLSARRWWMIGAFLLLMAPTAGAQKIKVKDQTGKLRDCFLTTYPKQLPSAETLFSADGLARLTAGNDTADAVFSLLFSTDGRLTALRQIVPDSIARSATLPLVPFVLLQPVSPDIWGVRLRASGSAPRSLTVERSLYCPPEFDRSTRYSRDRVRLMPIGWERTGGTLVAQIVISDSGTVTDAKVLQRTESSEADAAILEWLFEDRYHPALFDGLPVESAKRTDRPPPRR